MILNDPFPILIFMWPMYWLLLIPIVLIESFVYKCFSSARGLRKIFWPTITANIISTLFGIPVVWGVLVLIEFIFLPKFLEPVAKILSPQELILNITLGAAWIAPYAKSLFWAIPVAAMFLLIPFYFISIWIEGFVLTKLFKISTEVTLVEKSCWKANLASHLFLFLFCLGILVLSYIQISS